MDIKPTSNGTGFPPVFLEKIRTKATREDSNYYREGTTNKPPLETAGTANRKKYKIYIGGAGQGLAELAGLVDKGDPKFGRERGAEDIADIGVKMDGAAGNTTYEVPQKSELIFSNKTAGEHGAVISVTTSKEPIQTHISSIPNEETPPDEVVTLPPMMKRRFGKKPASPTSEPLEVVPVSKSPDTVTTGQLSPDERASPTENITSEMRNRLKSITFDDDKINHDKKPSDEMKGNEEDKNTTTHHH
jgi:hypothetical protein